jgi:hypothetical protein
MDKTQTISRQLWASGQNADYEEILTTSSATKLKLRIHVDPYASQGYGSIYLWRAGKEDDWSLLHRIPGQLLKINKDIVFQAAWSRRTNDERAELFAADRAELLRVAYALT